MLGGGWGALQCSPIVTSAPLPSYRGHVILRCHSPSILLPRILQRQKTRIPKPNHTTSYEDYLENRQAPSQFACFWQAWGLCGPHSAVTVSLRCSPLCCGARVFLFRSEYVLPGIPGQCRSPLILITQRGYNPSGQCVLKWLLSKNLAMLPSARLIPLND